MNNLSRFSWIDMLRGWWSPGQMATRAHTRSTGCRNEALSRSTTPSGTSCSGKGPYSGGPRFRTKSQPSTSNRWRIMLSFRRVIMVQTLINDIIMLVYIIISVTPCLLTYYTDLYLALASRTTWARSPNVVRLTKARYKFILRKSKHGATILS